MGKFINVLKMVAALAPIVIELVERVLPLFGGKPQATETGKGIVLKSKNL